MQDNVPGGKYWEYQPDSSEMEYDESIIEDLFNNDLQELPFI